MANLPLEVLPAAAQEALEAAEWYRLRSPKAAQGFLRAIREAFHRIQQSPESWSIHHHGTRRLLLHRFPYEIIFRVYPDMLLVVAIAHCKRRPDYWRER